jgi:hypothetical protein
MSIALLPCPLCGGQAKVSSDEINLQAHAYVSCRQCGLALKGKPFRIRHHCKCPEFRARRNEVRRAWNQRTQTPQPTPMNPLSETMPLEDILKGTSPGPTQCLPYDPMGGYDCCHGAVKLLDKDNRIIAVCDESNLPSLVGQGSNISVARAQQITQLMLNAALFSHCRNNFAKVVDALEYCLKNARWGVADATGPVHPTTLIKDVLTQAKTVKLP